MVAAGGDIEHAVKCSCLAGGCQHPGGTAFKRGNAGGHHIIGGVLKPCVEIAAVLQIEQSAHGLAGGILEGCALDNGNLTGFTVSRFITGMYASGANPVIFHRHSSTK